ncbi:dihydrolipoamide acetyltransferase family protein [Effusibacillus lacus]|uniref:Dihydrolipoamide acetyltransferase component of pyruvate dehydrogenase complex n=1 Tax=Effusibacillus lacus TaxID=1348429 RepID=A0A292YKS5_9BACL|nr:dihydrolipoamide acetyltransferase family protein [Effusibacillus lacus]TCS75891.1 pyruvate dehydrogenase E2 component (dihydrolipoamide acetyltransferase) [Effusibacillus lacus]GAX91717.1 branched-chain alpha-keto acid dehydrogenase subunit E2 [Effusibacillus lacus]
MAETIEVKLPETTADVNESLVVFWHHSEGEWVEQGTVLVEVQTEKAVFEVEAPASGKLSKIVVKRGEVAAVGDVLAHIEPASQDSGTLPSQDGKLTENELAKRQVASAIAEKQVQVSPRIRRLARELGVELSAVTGTGPHGRLTEDDIRKAAEQMKSGGRILQSTSIRKTIAKRMTESLRQSAQLTETSWADVTRLASFRKQSAPSVSWNSWILRATVLALMQHPYMNSVWDEDGLRTFEHVHLGIAVDTEEGLLVPVIHNAQQLSLQQLQDTFDLMIHQVRERNLADLKLTGSTFTVTNLGGYGIQFFTPILNPPESAILGVGQIEQQVVLREGNLEQRERLPLSLTFDHRGIDGAPAARFLQTVVKLLENPEQLL